MKDFSYSLLKDDLLKKEYGFGFERIIEALEGNLIDIIANPSYPQQKIFIVRINNYIYAVPFVEDEKGYFLKTFYPSRKLMRRYLKR
jgi:hypothetical protein